MNRAWFPADGLLVVCVPRDTMEIVTAARVTPAAIRQRKPGSKVDQIVPQLESRCGRHRRLPNAWPAVGDTQLAITKLYVHIASLPS